MRSCHEGLADLPTLAATFDVYTNWVLNDKVKGDFGEVLYNTPTQIQLCPWFVDWIRNKEYKSADDVKRTRIGRRVVKQAEANKWPLRQIGMLARLEIPFDRGMPLLSSHE
jgi:hypothetical protein